MIRYPNALDEIETAVSAEAKGWLKKAQTRTSLFAKLGRYTNEIEATTGKKKKLSDFWGDVKPLDMRRQYNKCVYCETRLEGGAAGNIQWDLEHFRPKSAVSRWPTAKSTLLYDFDMGGSAATDYYLLAYHLHNYAAACKTCNSPYKSDHFPIGGERIFGLAHPDDYVGEKALLVYPLGNGDDDPEDLITFTGERAEPKYTKEQDLHKWRRGRVMNDFFDLNRDGLQAQRAAWLLAVWSNRLLADKGEPFALKSLERLRSPRIPYSNCTKCFLDMCSANRPNAERLIPILEEIVRISEDG
ncbi:hypothetical protein LBMAG21_16060 [Armatimonadota bacterium]|nr:hypothetical protein LBMAG21_16060 [Armatimonadota bacterium]